MYYLYYFAVNIPITNEQLSESRSDDDNSSASSASVALITVFTILAVVITIIIGTVAVLIWKKRTMKSFEV